MNTQTLSTESAIASLADARQQHELLASQFSQLQSRLSQAEPGTVAFSDMASRAQSLKGKLQALTSEIQSLEPLAKTQRQREKESEAQRLQEQRQQEAQLDQDERDIDEAIAALNSASDQMAAALEAYFEGHRDARSRLQKAGRRNFSELGYDSRPDRHKLPWVQVAGKSANRTTRSGRQLMGRRA